MMGWRVAVMALSMSVAFGIALGPGFTSWAREFNVPIVATVTVKLGSPEELADVNEDGGADMADLRIVERSMGTSPPVDSRADVDRNQVVDIYDLSFVARYFEQATQEEGSQPPLVQ